MKERCPWVNHKNPLYVHYHDAEWGRPVHDDQKLFEMLCLEGAQAGLSWETVLNKRENYRKHFKDFSIHCCARMKDTTLEKILLDPGIIRNRRKIFGVRQNAKATLEVIKEWGSLDKYLWSFVGAKVITHRPSTLAEIPTRTEESDRMSKDLKKRGFTFVGSTICYAFMQAVGMVDDHTRNCFRATKVRGRK